MSVRVSTGSRFKVQGSRLKDFDFIPHSALRTCSSAFSASSAVTIARGSRIFDVEAPCSKLQEIFDPQGRVFILIAR
jgi:hypothetical protein